MKIIYTEPFKRDYKDLPRHVQRALGKALGFLLENIRYSSLRAKKLPGTEIWYARISRGYRFTFQFDNHTIILRRAGTHDTLNRERK